MGTVALEAEGPHIGKVTFAPTFRNGQDVIGIPECLSAAKFPFGGGSKAGGSAQAQEAAKFRDAVDAANGADASIPVEYTFSQVAGIAAQLPLLDAPVGAEGQPAGAHFEAAPTAETTATFTLGKSGAIGWSAGHGAPDAHKRLGYCGKVCGPL